MLCIDYHVLNKTTVRHSYSMPYVHDLLNPIGNSNGEHLETNGQIEWVTLVLEDILMAYVFVHLSRTHRSTVREARTRRDEHEILRTYSRLMRQ